MAPIKFEEHIKESLEKRRIEPSSKSWDTLSSQLDNTSKKKSPVWLWIGVAASFAGLVFLATTFFNTTNSPITTKKYIVETPAKDQENNSLVKTNDTDDINTSNKINEDANNQLATNKSNETSTQSKASKSQKYIAINKPRATNTSKKSKESIKANKTERASEIAIQEPQFQVATPKEDIAINTELTDEYLETLLKAASVRNANYTINENLSVDPNALLSDAQIQVERTFREKVFTVIKSGLEEVKSSVVTRAQKF
jgi:hypothetical protein